MMVYPPGGEGSWLEVLPPPYNDDPLVVAVLVPEGSRGLIEEGANGETLAVIVSPRGTRRCAQILEPHLAHWSDHVLAAEANGFDMISPDYVGRLSEMPKRLLLSSVRFPLLLLLDALWVAPLNLRSHLRSLTTSDEDNN